MIGVVVPSRTDEYLEGLLRSLDSLEGVMDAGWQCVVADNGLSAEFRQRWQRHLDPRCQFTQTPQPFCFAAAINGAVALLPNSADILILNDDATVVTNLWCRRSVQLLQGPEYARYGLISLAIDGGVGNPEQKHVLWSQDAPAVTETAKTLCFVAVLVRRAAWNAVGPLDERFASYGFDDDDYCRRMRLAGWLCGVTQRIVVAHGHNSAGHSSSYMRYHGQDGMDRLFHENQGRYIEKWGGPPGYERISAPTPYEDSGNGS